MDKELKKEAIKQYLRYFTIWFILVGVIVVLFLGMFIRNLVKSNVPRGNQGAPTERVYDYADVLTDKEEEALRKLIAKEEAKNHFDIVLVTTKEPMKSTTMSWDDAMMNYADDFYDHNNYGYNVVHGDGVLLLDNWYPNEEGSWLCTTGRVLDKFSYYDVDEVLDAVSSYIDYSPYKAYKAYVKAVVRQMKGKPEVPVWGFVIVPTIVALIYLFSNLKSRLAEKTVVANTYVENGRPVMRGQSDTFVRKFVTTRRIERSSSSGGGGKSGGAGSHRSSSGVRHGGGGRRR